MNKMNIVLKFLICALFLGNVVYCRLNEDNKEQQHRELYACSDKPDLACETRFGRDGRYMTNGRDAFACLDLCVPQANSGTFIGRGWKCGKCGAIGGGRGDGEDKCAAEFACVDGIGRNGYTIKRRGPLAGLRCRQMCENYEGLEIRLNRGWECGKC